MEDHFLPVLPALQARRDHCDAMVCAMSAGEVMKLTRMGKFDMAAPASGPMALLKRLRGKPEAKRQRAGGNGHRRRAADEDAAPAAEDPALHPRHRAGRAGLFPDAAVLARRLGGERRQHGAVPGRPLRRRPAPALARLRAKPHAAGRLPGSRRLPPAHARRRMSAQRRRPAARRHQRQARHGRPAADALLPAGRQRRPLRRRDHRDGGARPARGPGLRDRARRAPGDRRLLPRGRRAGDRRAGLADRLLAGRRPGLQRRPGRRGHAGPARRALPRRHAGRVPDARPVGRARRAACCRSRRP